MSGPKPPSVSAHVARFVIRDLVFDVVHFPLWWYTRGTVQAWQFVWREFLSVLDRLSIRILIRNFFKPMYGDYTKSGRIISFFMRLIVFLFRFVGLTLWTGVLFAMLVVWLAVLPLVVFQIVRQLTG